MTDRPWEHGKRLVRRLVDEVINAEDLAVMNEICTPQLAADLWDRFARFRTGFPDWRQEIVELVAEGSKVVARCACRGTNLGPWLGVAATGRTMRVDEVWIFTLVEERLGGLWSLEDTWGRVLHSGRSSRPSPPRRKTRRRPQTSPPRRREAVLRADGVAVLGRECRPYTAGRMPVPHTNVGGTQMTITLVHGGAHAGRLTPVERSRQRERRLVPSPRCLALDRDVRGRP